MTAPSGREPLRIVFLCVENSCRSQMAEGFARALAPEGVEVYSAGSRPSGKVNATAIEVMREAAIDIASHSSKSVLDLPPARFDAAVTMGCGDACPTINAARRIDWSIRDPKSLPPEEFRAVRDEIRARVAALLADLRRPG
ncbi:MAG: arsenate reductase ArsC [Phycisphaerales bacterium]